MVLSEALRNEDECCVFLVVCVTGRMATTTSLGLGFPFTNAQWKELERQAMIYKYMMNAVPVPPELLIPSSRTSSDPAASHAPCNDPFKSFLTFVLQSLLTFMMGCSILLLLTDLMWVYLSLFTRTHI